MANRPIKVKIDVTKINKDHLYPGKNGAKYLNLVMWPNKSGVGPYGDTHYAVQEISKEARDSGEKGPIVGNATIPESENQPAAGAAPYQPRAKSPDTKHKPEVDDSDLPF